MSRIAFIDQATGVLKAHGYVEANQPGDVAVPVGDEFDKVPGQWAYVNGAWQPYVMPSVACDAVDAFRDARLAAGYADAETGKTWQCDDRSQGKWTAIGSAAGLALVMGTSPAPTFDMIPADNDTVTLTATQAFALINGRLLPWVSATMIYARALKDQIDAGNPPADITIGWP